MADALAIIIDAHRELPLSAALGDGSAASSDGQFFPSSGSGEAMNLINAKYGNIPGVKAAHISHQYGPFAVKTTPATAHEAPYILDGLTMNDTGKRSLYSTFKVDTDTTGLAQWSVHNQHRFHSSMGYMSPDQFKRVS